MLIGRFTVRRIMLIGFLIQVMSMMVMIAPFSPDKVLPGSAKLYQKSQSQRSATFRERISGHRKAR